MAKDGKGSGLTPPARRLIDAAQEVYPPRTQWPALYRSGWTQLQIAMQAGVSQQTVGNHLRLLGVEMRPQGVRKGSHWSHVGTRERPAPPPPVDPPLEYAVDLSGDYYGVGY
jgi:hypothetical protein